MNINIIVDWIFKNISILSVTIAAIALIINAIQFIKNTKITRLSFVTKILTEFASNEKFQDIFYKIEYGEFEYDQKFHKSKIEQDIDGLLRHFSLISIAYFNKQLELKDIASVEYYIYRICGNPEIKKYLSFLENWIDMSKYGSHPFLTLIKLHDILNNNRMKKLNIKSK